MSDVIFKIGFFGEETAGGSLERVKEDARIRK